MKIIYTKHFPLKRYSAINIFGILFVREDCKDLVGGRMIRHETIHTKQMKEMLWIFFYLWYGIEWLIIFCSGKHSNFKSIYHDISFEEEAYNNEKNESYLENRKHYSWFKYLKLGSYAK